MCVRIYQGLNSFPAKKQEYWGSLLHPAIVSHSLQMQTNGETGFDQATAPTYHAEVLL